jgi:hypothetical protein
MPDLGTVGTYRPIGLRATGSPTYDPYSLLGMFRPIGLAGGKPRPSHIHKMTIIGSERWYTRIVKSVSEGNPSQPSMNMPTHGMFKFRWTVSAGTKTIQCSVKQPDNGSPRPSLVVKANTDIGVNSDVTVTAAAGIGWVTLGPATISPSSLGAVWVELHNNYDALYSPCYWDNITVT